jgi:hypothetical protein
MDHLLSALRRRLAVDTKIIGLPMYKAEEESNFTKHFIHHPQPFLHTLRIVKCHWYNNSHAKNAYSNLPFPHAPMNNRTCLYQLVKDKIYMRILTAKIIQHTLMYGLNRSPILAHFQNTPHTALQTSATTPVNSRGDCFHVRVLLSVHKSREELMAVCAGADEEEQHHEGRLEVEECRLFKS